MYLTQGNSIVVNAFPGHVFMQFLEKIIIRRSMKINTNVKVDTETFYALLIIICNRQDIYHNIIYYC